MQAKRLLYEPRKAARAVQLANNPTPLDEILMSAQYLGIGRLPHPQTRFERSWAF